MLPTKPPASSRSGDAVMLTGVFRPRRVTKSPSPLALSWRGGWVFLASSNSQGSRLKSRSSGFRRALAAEISVSVSAASLKKTILPCGSTVMTPSSRLVRICPQEISLGDGFLVWLKAFTRRFAIGNK